MNRQMLRSKIHRISVTECDVEYEGSLTLDLDLLEAADMIPFERVDVFDIENGNRFTTYLMEGERGTGECCVNGAAAHLVKLEDKLILATYYDLDPAGLKSYRPRIIIVGPDNRIIQNPAPSE